jgi:hypothetical protein
MVRYLSYSKVVLSGSIALHISSYHVRLSCFFTAHIRHNDMFVRRDVDCFLIAYLRGNDLFITRDVGEKQMYSRHVRRTTHETRTLKE